MATDTVGAKTRIAMGIVKQASYASPRHPNAPAPKTAFWKTKKVYTGAELKEPPARIGAGDAFKLPSKGTT